MTLVPPPPAPVACAAALKANSTRADLCCGFRTTHGPSRALLVPIEGKVVEGFVRARHGVQVVVDVVRS